MIKITRTAKFSAVVDFATVAKAMGQGMHNIPSSEQGEGGELEQFLRKQKLLDTPHVFMATHSIGRRDWELAEGCTVPFYEESAFSAGWSVLTDQNSTFLCCESATSGSVIWARKQGDGMWEITLEVPVETTGAPYKGHYYHSFMEGLGQPEMEVAA
jgi:hypothetical protein